MADESSVITTDPASFAQRTEPFDMEPAIRQALINMGSPEDVPFWILTQVGAALLVNWLLDDLYFKAKDIAAREFFDGREWLAFETATVEQHQRAEGWLKQIVAARQADADRHRAAADALGDEHGTHGMNNTGL